MSHQHSAVSLQWSRTVFRPSIIHIFCYSLMLRFIYFFLIANIFSLTDTAKPRITKKWKKILVLAGPVKNIHALRAVSRPPLWIRISPATHSAFTQAWTVSLSQRKAPLQGDAATAMLHSGDVAGQWAVPSLLLLWRLKLMPKCSVLLIADTESCFSQSSAWEASVWWRSLCSERPSLQQSNLSRLPLHMIQSLSSAGRSSDRMIWLLTFICQAFHFMTNQLNWPQVNFN